jgi:hypothetical protein
MAKLTDTHNLAVVKPDIAKEWHPSRNGKLTPKDVTPSSCKKVWWKCSKDHDWQASIFGRSNGNGCPYCAGQLPTKDYNLKVINPKLAKQWHPVKNGKLTPKNVTPGSSRKVWWICSKGHEWRAIVKSRNSGKRCPYCIGKKACLDNCLKTLNPSLAKQWHSSRNGKLTPKDVTAGSGKKVWWKCKEGHVWKAVVNNRNYGNGCPECRWL